MNKIDLTEPKVDVFNDLGFHDISELVKSISTYNSLNTPVGTMRIVLNPAINAKLPSTILHNRIVNELIRKIKLNSVISAKIDRESDNHVFLGRVDNVTPINSYEGSSTKRLLEIRCSLLLPKLLIRDNIVNSPVLSTNKKLKEEFGDRVKFFYWMRGGRDDRGNVFAAGKPEEAVKYILENAVATNSTVIDVANGALISKTFFNPKKADTLKFQFLTGERLYSPYLSAYSGNILNYIYQCIDKDYYEVFFDTETGSDGLAYNTMAIRPKPFSYRDYSYSPNAVRNWLNWDDLEGEAVEKTAEYFVLNDSLGKSDFELKNFFTVNFLNSLVASSNSYFGKFGLQFPIVNVDSVKKYGLRELSMVSKLINYDRVTERYSEAAKDGKVVSISELLQSEKLESGGTYLDYLLDKREKGVEWYSFPYFESGRASFIGDEYLRVGKLLFLKDRTYIHPESEKEYKGVYYYINSVNNNWEQGRLFRTDLELTRGAHKGVVPAWLNENRHNFVSTTAEDYTEYAVRSKGDKLSMNEINKIEAEMGRNTNSIEELS